MGTVGCRLIRELREVFVCQKSRRLGSRRDRRERSDTGGGRGVSRAASRVAIRIDHRRCIVTSRGLAVGRVAVGRGVGLGLGIAQSARVALLVEDGDGAARTTDRLSRGHEHALFLLVPLSVVWSVWALYACSSPARTLAPRGQRSLPLSARVAVCTRAAAAGFKNQKLQKFRRAAFAVSNQPSRWWWWNTLLFNCGARPTKRTRTAMAAGVTLCASLAYALYHPLGVRTSPGPRARSGAAAHAALSDSRS